MKTHGKHYRITVAKVWQHFSAMATQLRLFFERQGAFPKELFAYDNLFFAHELAKNDDHMRRFFDA